VSIPIGDHRVFIIIIVAIVVFGGTRRIAVVIFGRDVVRRVIFKSFMGGGDRFERDLPARLGGGGRVTRALRRNFEGSMQTPSRRRGRLGRGGK
jgi:hypothetical protein